MPISPEPRFAKVASMLADPTRARMLAALMGGTYLAAGELAAAAGVTAQTASGHLAKLAEADLVVLRRQGRHRYVRLADERIAHALEALSLVAEQGSAAADKWTRPPYRAMKVARTCYCHLAGELGVRLLDGLLREGVLLTVDDHFAVSEAGLASLQAHGLTARVPSGPVARRRYAYPCLDWSERRDHLAGGLATALLDHALARDWLRRTSGSRALQLTPDGQSALGHWIGR